MAIPNNYIDKITKGNDSRDICPAADKVRVNNENFEGTDLDGVLDEIAESISGAGGEAVHSVTVETPEDGTVGINVDDDTYTINLNHTHENMAKLVVCEESDLPATLAKDTIYAQVDDADNPTEIEVLYIAGLEFAGGGAAPGTPRLTSPSQSQISNGINIGNTTSGVATYLLKIKARDLTQSLLVQWGIGSTGYSFNTSNLPTGVTYDSGTGKLTITKEAACEINGVSIPVVYTGSDTDENAEGTIGISSSSVDGINAELSLITNKVTYEQLTAIKLTGTQWGQTDFVPTPNTDVEMTLKFTETSRSWDSTEKGYYFLTCYTLQSSQKQYSIYLKEQISNQAIFAAVVTNSTVNTLDLSRDSVVLDKSKFSYSHDGLMKFVAGENGTVYTKQSTAVSQQTDPLTIGLYHYTSGTDSLFNKFILTIYELKITDNGTVVRDYKPVRRNGIPGLYDELTGHFISSKTSDAVEEVISGS